MKIRKERKQSVDVQNKEKKIGRIFNPAMRILRCMIIATAVYLLLVVSATTVVPAIGGLLGSIVNVNTMDGWPVLIATWVMPYLFLTGFVFVADYMVIRWFVKRISRWTDKIVDDYRQKRIDGLHRNGPDVK